MLLSRLPDIGERARQPQRVRDSRHRNPRATDWFAVVGLAERTGWPQAAVLIERLHFRSVGQIGSIGFMLGLVDGADG